MSDNAYMTYPFRYAHYFIPEFITRLRFSRDCEEKLSPRQGINMGRLLLPPFLRQGHLTFEDLLNAAVVTSNVDCQKAAEKIAAEILVNLESEEMQEPEYDFTGDDFLSLLTKQSDDEVYVTPHGKGLENDFAASHNSDVDQFESFQNKPDIGVGPGEDEIIKAGVKVMKNKKSEEARKILAELLKEKLLKLGREFERKEEWSKHRNLTPFQPGEDPDLIDEERSLDNILDLGRSLEEIRYDDFLMRRREQQKRTIIYILDISNTMFYDLEGINSISYSVLSMVPLMWGLRREKYGLCLYESNSHIMKDLYEEINLIPVMEDLISMVTLSTTEMEKKFSGGFMGMTWGGTVPGKSLEWAYQQITDISDRSDRVVFIFSDFVLTQPGELTEENMQNYKILERMVDLGVRVCACVSPLAHKSIFRPYTKESLDRMRKIGIHMIDTYKPSGFLDDAQSFIEEG
ncbi:hypothetical protein JXL21_08455 [Candidatus Bathyarchaeota archaeon]|nr:hypothetical protein [Candidatus Bathyarchaeota archaeon]